MFLQVFLYHIYNLLFYMEYFSRLDVDAGVRLL